MTRRCRQAKFILSLRSSVLALTCSALAACQNVTPVETIGHTPGALQTGIPYSLPRPVLKVVIDPTAMKEVDKAKSSFELIPDPNATYVARFNLSQGRNDSLKVGVNNKGLLTSLTTSSEATLPAVASEIISSIKNVVVAKRTKREAGSEKKPKEFRIDLHKHHFPEDVTVTFLDDDLNKRIRNHVRNDPKGPSPVRPRICATGASLCVPFLTPAVVTVDYGGVLTEIDVVIPHPEKVHALRLDRHSCVQDEAELILADGILTSLQVVKPSEVAACAKIPLDIVSAIIAAPIDAVTGRTTRLQNETELLQAQIALIKAQQDLEAAQKDTGQE